MSADELARRLTSRHLPNPHAGNGMRDLHDRAAFRIAVRRYEEQQIERNRNTVSVTA